MQVTHYDPEPRRRLLRFIARRINNPDDIEDLAQDVHLRLLEAREQVLQNPMAYFYRTARNVIYDYFRKNQRIRDHIIFDTTEAESAADSPPRELAGRAESQWEYSEVRDAALGLPKGVREVIQLACEEFLSVAETADAMGIAESSVVKYRTTGKQKLQSYLKGHSL